jgi:hypothetical protein
MQKVTIRKVTVETSFCRFEGISQACFGKWRYSELALVGQKLDSVVPEGHALITRPGKSGLRKNDRGRGSATFIWRHSPQWVRKPHARMRAQAKAQARIPPR